MNGLKLNLFVWIVNIFIMNIEACGRNKERQTGNLTTTNRTTTAAASTSKTTTYTDATATTRFYLLSSTEDVEFDYRSTILINNAWTDPLVFIVSGCFVVSTIVTVTVVLCVIRFRKRRNLMKSSKKPSVSYCEHVDYSTSQQMYIQADGVYSSLSHRYDCILRSTTTEESEVPTYCVILEN